MRPIEQLEEDGAHSFHLGSSANGPESLASTDGVKVDAKPLNDRECWEQGKPDSIDRAMEAERQERAAGVPGIESRVACVHSLASNCVYPDCFCTRTGTTVREFTNELGNRIRITIEGPTSTSENVLTPMEAVELRAALDAHGAALPQTSA